jgi:4-amino-4-deoxy-L-arabinose transferase-like glycosyltransferase
MDILFEKSPSRHLTLAGITIDQRWLRRAVPLGLFLAAFLPRALGLNVFLTADEDDQMMFASLFLKSVLQGDWAGALVLGYPGVPTLMLGALGVAARYWFHYQGWLPLAWVQADLMTTLDQVTTRFGVFEYPLDFLVWVRLPLVLVASLSIFGIYLLTKQLLNERLAILSTLIIAFEPFILAHTRIIHVDAPLAYFMFLSFLAFLLYLEQGSWRWLILSGLFGGLAALSKTPAALLGPILVVSGLLYALLPPPGLARSVRWKRLVVAVLGWGVLAAGAFTALWPAMWTRPTFALEWIIKNIQSVNQLPHPTTGHFWGGQFSDQSPYYYLAAFPFHLTPLTTLGVVAGLGLIGAGLAARWRKPAHWTSSVLPLAMSLVVYVVCFIAPVSLISRRGDRYILPIFFATGLLSALALWWLAGFLRKYLATHRPELTRTRLVGAAIALQVILVLFYHPYYLAYYNPLLGGSSIAPYRLNVGWGEGLDLAARYLNELKQPQPPQVVAWYSNQFAPFYQGQTMDLSDQTSALTGEYTVFYINQVQRGFPSREILTYFQQREPLHVVKLGGINYAWIYPGPVISKNPPQDYAFPTQALLAGGARLVGVDVPHLELAVDAYPQILAQQQNTKPRFYDETLPGLPVTLYWETVGQISGEHNIYLRLVDAKGNSWGQVDRLILAGLWRPDRWRAGYFVRDEYKLPIDPATPPGIYHLEVGMYDFVTGQSYGVVKNIGTMTLTPPQKLPQPAEVKLQTRLSTPLNQALTLVGHNYSDRDMAPGAEITGKLYWQATQSGNKDYLLEFSFLAPEQKKYVIAESTLSPTYPPAQWRRSEVVGAAYRFRTPASTPPGSYPLTLSVLDPDTRELVGPPISLATITVKAQERNFKLPQDVTPLSAFINDEIELLGYKLQQQTVAPKKSFGLTLYWRSLRPAAANYTVFVHAVGPDQVIRGQWDSVPQQGAAPTSGWLPNEIIEDHYDIPMAKDAPAWKYDIFVGMYDPLTGQRLPTASHNVPVSENRVWLTRVQVVD